MSTLIKFSESTAQRGWFSYNCVLTALSVIMLMLIPIVPTPEFWITLLNYIELYNLIALRPALLTGVGGLTSFGQTAFVGLGAYSTAYLITQYSVSPWINLWVGLVITMTSAYVIGLVTMRMSGHYLPLATIARGLSLFFLLSNLRFLGKYDGLSGIPVLNMLGKSLQVNRKMFYPTWAVVVVTVPAVQDLLNSCPDRAICALKGNDMTAEVIGVSTAWMEAAIFMLAAVLVYILGSLYAHLQRVVNPAPFGLNYGIEYLFMAVVGGTGHVQGAVLGAGLLTILKDSLQSILPKLLGFDDNFGIIVFGMLLVLLLQYTHDGVWPFIRKLFPSPPTARVPDDASTLKQREKLRAGGLILDMCATRKEFGGLVAMNDVSLQMKAGEIIGLVGLNGTGKSTTFSLMAGVLPVTCGEVLYRGEHISGKPPREIAKRGIGRTSRHVQLLSGMTVLENVALGTRLRDDFAAQGGAFVSVVRMNQAKEQKLLLEARRQLERMGLVDYIYQKAGGLILGQQCTLEIVRTLCCDPTLLLLDEPATGLRHKEEQALATLLTKLKAEGMSVLLVEYDVDLVTSLTDRLVVMEFDIKIAEGLPQEVQQNPVVLEAYPGGVEQGERAYQSSWERGTCTSAMAR